MDIHKHIRVSLRENRKQKNVDPDISRSMLVGSMAGVASYVGQRNRRPGYTFHFLRDANDPK
jgi:hypothetical protein